MITITKIREILRLVPVNPKKEYKFRAIAEADSLEYWEQQIITITKNLNNQANKHPDTIRVEDYKMMMVEVIRHAVLCINTAEGQYGSNNSEEAREGRSRGKDSTGDHGLPDD